MKCVHVYYMYVGFIYILVPDLENLKRYMWKYGKQHKDSYGIIEITICNPEYKLVINRHNGGFHCYCTVISCRKQI
jgi:hypothetical protein